MERTTNILRKAVLVLALALGGCASISPRIDLLGAAPEPEGRSVLLFVEVTNPTQRDLTLSRFAYEVSSPTWRSATGDVTLSRPIHAGASAVIEVALDVPPSGLGGHEVALRGRLYAKDQDIVRSWPVSGAGRLDRRAGGATFRPLAAVSP